MTTMEMNGGLPWFLFILSCFVLLFTPIISTLSSKFERESKLTQTSIYVLLIMLVIYHILGEAVRSSGPYVSLFALSGFLVAMAVSMVGRAMKIHDLPVMPLVIAITMALHGILDGYAFRFVSAAPKLSATAFSFPLACLLHRIPESLFLWRMVSKKVSFFMAIMTLFILGFTTLLGLVLSEDILRYGQPYYLNLCYLQVFVAGAILQTALSSQHLLAR